jgi:uncharacterized protein
MPVILEGIVTTLNSDGTVNISPMGPEVDESLEQLILKPFQTSTTYRNLKRTGQGVFHVTDDVELLAQAAIGTPDPIPRLLPAPSIDGRILANACRWYAFQVTSLDDSQERTRIEAEVVDSGAVREFFGFNRAKHAVLELAILATRIGILPAEEISSQMERLRPLVTKTGGPTEQRAWNFLETHIKSKITH